MSSADVGAGDHTACGLDAAAYALGSLEPDEAAAFAAHLRGCTICRDELAAFQHVAQALPLAAPQVPAPKRLRRRVHRAVRAQHRAQPGPQRTAWPNRGAPGAKLLRPAAGLLAAALLALATAAGIGLIRGSSPAREYPTAVIGPGTAQLRVAGSHAELTVQHLPQPRAGHIYEVWLQRPHHPPAPTTALFSVTSSGTGDVAVPGNITGVSQVMVTEEPAGGSTVPTTRPLIIASLRSGRPVSH